MGIVSVPPLPPVSFGSVLGQISFLKVLRLRVSCSGHLMVRWRWTRSYLPASVTRSTCVECTLMLFTVDCVR